MKTFESGFNKLDPTNKNEKTGEPTIDEKSDNLKELENQFYGMEQEINQALLAKGKDEPMDATQKEVAFEYFKEATRGSRPSPENMADYLAEKLINPEN